MQIVPPQTTKSLAACFLFLSQIVKGHLCCVCAPACVFSTKSLRGLSSSDILMQIALKLCRCSLRQNQYNKINNHHEFGDTLNQYDIDAALWN